MTTIGEIHIIPQPAKFTFLGQATSQQDKKFVWNNGIQYYSVPRCSIGINPYIANSIQKGGIYENDSSVQGHHFTICDTTPSLNNIQPFIIQGKTIELNSQFDIAFSINNNEISFLDNIIDNTFSLCNYLEHDVVTNIEVEYIDNRHYKVTDFTVN